MSRIAVVVLAAASLLLSHVIRGDVLRHDACRTGYRVEGC